MNLSCRTHLAYSDVIEHDETSSSIFSTLLCIFIAAGSHHWAYGGTAIL
jgi:hypothetical protein